MGLSGRATTAVAKAIAWALHLDDLGVVEKAVQNGGGGRDIVQEFSPFLDRAVGSHEGGAVLVTAHNDLQKHLPGFGRQHLESHIIDEQQIGLEVASQASIQLGWGLIGLELAHQVEDGAVKDLEPGFDGVVADGLGQVALD